MPHSGFWTILCNIFPEPSWVPLTTRRDGSGLIVMYKPLFGAASAFLTLKHKSLGIISFPSSFFRTWERSYLFQTTISLCSKGRRGILPRRPQFRVWKAGVARTPLSLGAPATLLSGLFPRLGLDNAKFAFVKSACLLPITACSVGPLVSVICLLTLSILPLSFFPPKWEQV